MTPSPSSQPPYDALAAEVERLREELSDTKATLDDVIRNREEDLAAERAERDQAVLEMWEKCAAAVDLQGNWNLSWTIRALKPAPKRG